MENIVDWGPQNGEEEEERRRESTNSSVFIVRQISGLIVGKVFDFSIVKSHDYLVNQILGFSLSFWEFSFETFVNLLVCSIEHKPMSWYCDIKKNQLDLKKVI